MTRSPYEVPDPLPVRLKDFYWRRIHCPVLGHKHQQKMYCTICERCRIVLSTR